MKYTYYEINNCKFSIEEIQEDNFYEVTVWINGNFFGTYCFEGATAKAEAMEKVLSFSEISEDRYEEEAEEPKEESIVKVINEQINEAYYEFNKYGKTQWYFRCISRVNGMIDVLKVLTGKEYGFDESGLHERKAV